MRAIKKFERRSHLQQFFNKHDEIWQKEIENIKRKRIKKEERRLRAAAGEQVSDSSSVREEKERAKERYLRKIKKEMMVTEAELLE